MIMRSRKRNIIIFLFVAVAAVFALSLLWIFSENKVPPGTTPADNASDDAAEKGVSAVLQTVTQWVDAVGTVAPRAQANIAARISAPVTDVRVRAGDRVKPDDVLVVLDDRRLVSRRDQARQSLNSAAARKQQALQAVNAAEAALTRAKSAYERIKNFYEAQAATEQQYEEVRAAWLQAAAGLKQAEDGLTAARAGEAAAKEMVREAEIALGYTRITAPAEGVVLKRLVDPGDLALPGNPLLLLHSEDGLQLEAHVRESLVQHAAPGEILQVELKTLGETVQARVEELVPFADPRTRTFLVKARLPHLPGLYPGMYGKLLIPYRQVDVVLIPKTAVRDIGQLELVMVKSPHGWRRRYIKTGSIYGNRVEVLSGLDAGEVVKAKEIGDDG